MKTNDFSAFQARSSQIDQIELKFHAVLIRRKCVYFVIFHGDMIEARKMENIWLC